MRVANPRGSVGTWSQLPLLGTTSTVFMQYGRSDLVAQSRILSLREHRVVLDADVAQLYGVEIRVLAQAVKRNLARFPDDFMFQLSVEELAYLRSQSVISSGGHGGRCTVPYAFTEQGVAVLPSVLRSRPARHRGYHPDHVHTFVRERAAVPGDLAKRLDELEEKTEAPAIQHDTFSRNTSNQLKQVFDAIREPMMAPDPPKRRLAFVTPEERKTRHKSSNHPGQ